MFEIKGKDFLLDGEPFTVRSGAVHYFRILPEYWRDRLTKLKLAGFNTVETYICWNLHEPQKGSFNFSGMLDFERFLDISAKLGLCAIVRPSPYICAEFDFGGLPSWLLADRTIRLRCSDERYLAHVEDYYRELMPRLVPHQIGHGGNVIMMQVENEYGSFGNDSAYLRSLAEMMRDLGITVPLFTSDGTDDGMLTGGTLPELLKTANFGSHTSDNLAKLRAFAPNEPLMCMEFWNGWFDHWGETHCTRSADEIAHELKSFLDLGASFNFYMFCGGTNFAFTAGANHDGCYSPTVTSYDYDALLTEWGDYTPKYHVVRRLLHKHLGIKKEQLPPPPMLQHIGKVYFTHSASFIDQARNVGAIQKSLEPMTMEEMGQWHGYILYRTVLGGAYSAGTITVDGLCDRAHVFLDGQLLGTVYRGDGTCSLPFPGVSHHGATLEIFAESLGRVNYGHEIYDRKGIAGARINGQRLFYWENIAIGKETLKDLSFTAGTDAKLPAIFRGTFHTDSRDDCFIHPTGFTNGIILVNGFNLGRYREIGPQRSLYLPGAILKKENTVEIVELDCITHPTAEITDKHDLG